MDFNNTNNKQYLINASDETKNELNQNYSLWYVFSLLSWFLFICCQIESYLSDLKNIHENFYILKIFILLISLAGLIVYLVFTSCKKNQNLYNGMLGEIQNFILFFFVRFCFIYNWPSNENK